MGCLLSEGLSNRIGSPLRRENSFSFTITAGRKALPVACWQSGAMAVAHVARRRRALVANGAACAAAAEGEIHDRFSWCVVGGV